MRHTPVRAFNQLRSRSYTTGTVTATPVAIQSQGNTPPRRPVTSMERSAPQRRSSLTFRTTPTTEGILNKTPGTAPSGRVYGTFSGMQPNLENMSPPEMRLPPSIRSIPEQPEPEDASAQRRSQFLSSSSFALPPPALPTPQQAVSTPHFPCVSLF